MDTGLCHSGNWGALANMGLSGWIGIIASVIFWIGLIAALITLVVWAIRRARDRSTAAAYVSGQPTTGGQNTAREILQAQYAQGEISREQYELKKEAVG